MQGKISKRAIDAIKAGGADVFLWDDELPGFGLKVTPTGRKVYVLQARIANRVRRFTIGKHGAPWTPDSARLEAKRLIGLIATGADPTTEKAALKRDITISALCDLYLEEGGKTKKPRTLGLERSLIERHIKKLIGHSSVLSLTQRDVERLLANIAAGKSAADIKTKKRGRAIVRGGKGIANRTIELLASIMTFAIARHVRADNPVRGVRKFKLQPRQRFLTSDEMATLGTKLMEAEAVEDPYALAAIRFLLFTGCRKSEALTLQWAWVDLERAVINLPDSKTGAKPVLLTAPALDLLSNLPRIKDNPYVFAGRGPVTHFVGLHRVWGRIRQAAGIPEVRIHDLRHSFASVGAGRGDSLYVVGKLLGHTQARTTQRYAHLADTPLRIAGDAIANQIDAAMRGKSAQVVPLKKTRHKVRN